MVQKFVVCAKLQLTSTNRSQPNITLTNDIFKTNNSILETNHNEITKEAQWGTSISNNDYTWSIVLKKHSNFKRSANSQKEYDWSV